MRRSIPVCQGRRRRGQERSQQKGGGGVFERRWKRAICEPCGLRFLDGKTGPLSATFECRWCKATSTCNRRAGPTGEDELCDSCGGCYAKASAKIKARLDHVEKELVRLTSVPVFDVDAGTETRGPAPKRARDDATPASGGLKALKTATDETAGVIVEVKREKAAVEGQRDRTDAVAAEASAAAATANADAATAAEDRLDAQDTLGYQVRFTNALQTKIDKLAALAKANGVDAAAVDAIKNGPNL